MNYKEKRKERYLKCLNYRKEHDLIPGKVKLQEATLKMTRQFLENELKILKEKMSILHEKELKNAKDSFCLSVIKVYETS